jgi:hypothetical protein
MRIRGGAHEPWMNGDVDQVSFADKPTRLFLLTASMYGLPVQALHHYSEGSARFQVRLGGFIPIVDAKGPVVDKTETVTLFNDMVMLAPGTLISPNIAWETLGDSRVKATFENGGHRISAELVFDSQGFPADFISDDRSRSSKDGKSFTAQRFSTPVLAVASYGDYRLVSRGEAHWHAPSPEGEFSYGEYELFKVAYNKPLQ